MTGAAEPVLRWVGGKRRLAPVIASYFPPVAGRYFEPFVGAGALFLSLTPSAATLGDKNADLINFYRCLREQPDRISARIAEEGSCIDASCYYKLRERFNASIDPLERAYLFLILNRTCFNGIWRVNAKNRFNVPFGDRGKLDRVDDTSIAKFSQRLQGVELFTGDFEDCLKDAKTGDFAYLDPPYIPIGAAESFNRYTEGGFSIDQHKAVARVLTDLTIRGVAVAVSQSDTELVRELFDGNRFVQIEARRTTQARGGHLTVNEVLILNF